MTGPRPLPSDEGTAGCAARGSGPLAGFVEALRRDLSADAVAVACRSRADVLRLVATAGLSSEEVRDFRMTVDGLDRELARAADDQPVPLNERPGRAFESLAGSFRQALAVGLTWEGEHLGVMYLLNRVARAPVDEGLLRAYGRPAMRQQSGWAACVDDGILRAYARHAAVAVRLCHCSPRPASGHVPRSTLRAIDSLAVRARSFPDLISALTEALFAVFGPVSAGTMLWDDQRDVLQMVPGSFGADEATAGSYRASTLAGNSNAARVFNTGQPYFSNHASGDPAILQDYVEAFEITRLLTLPLDFDGRRLGVLHLANPTTDFRLRDLVTIGRLAPRIAMAHEIARGFRQLRRDRRLEGVLAEVAVAVASGQGIHEFLASALDEFCDAMDAGLVSFVPTELSPIVWRSQRVIPERERKLLAHARRQPSTGAELCAPTRAGDPGWAAFHVPVHFGRQRVGTLSALRGRAEPFADDECTALARLAQIAALAWTAERYQQHRAELARLDEQQRIADCLHDDVAQLLFAAGLALDAVVHPPDGGAGASVVRARELIDGAEAALRRTVTHLSSSSPNTLAEQMSSVVADTQRAFGRLIHLEVGEPAITAAAGLRTPARDMLVRVARECLVNAAKHAGPCRIVLRVDVTRRKRLIVTIIDDGIGLHRSDGRHGLASLRRAVRTQGGTLRIESPVTGGTKVTVSLSV